MDREALNDYPLGHYDVDGQHHDVRARPRDRLDDRRRMKPPIGHVYGYTLEPDRRRHARHVVLRLVEDRPDVEGGGHLPDHPRGRLRATLGILARTVARRDRRRLPDLPGLGGDSSTGQGSRRGHPQIPKGAALRTLMSWSTATRTRHLRSRGRRAACSVRRVPAIALGVVFAAYLVGRGVVELFQIDYSNPASYQNAWGGPHLWGVLAVHAGPGLAIVVATAVIVARRHRSRSSGLRVVRRPPRQPNTH